MKPFLSADIPIGRWLHFFMQGALKFFWCLCFEDTSFEDIYISTIFLIQVFEGCWWANKLKHKVTVT